MGFTIDMVSGDVSNITGSIASENAEEDSSTNALVGEECSLEEEKMLPVSDTCLTTEVLNIPGFIINRDIDSIIDDMTSN